ncbi:hypothetical protein LPW11_18565 [Geomonas sp. RF6]|uniref:hypothetical protein n=1 Tax=Geomonas sp. RF6 TaxID=2897342 RepID=UPI001E5A2BFD|nr:hypothetical protein [Geomonas sp. RF6]UFS69877.1 hypothetical protein LPW11_18565 [Geomonas sp. RF6]
MRRSRYNSRIPLTEVVSKIKETERVCAVCGSELEIEPESGELHCPVCEENAAP